MKRLSFLVSVLALLAMVVATGAQAPGGGRQRQGRGQLVVVGTVTEINGERITVQPRAGARRPGGDQAPPPAVSYELTKETLWAQVREGERADLEVERWIALRVGEGEESVATAIAVWRGEAEVGQRALRAAAPLLRFRSQQPPAQFTPGLPVVGQIVARGDGNLTLKVADREIRVRFGEEMRVDRVVPMDKGAVERENTVLLAPVRADNGEATKVADVILKAELPARPTRNGARG